MARMNCANVLPPIDLFGESSSQCSMQPKWFVNPWMFRLALPAGAQMAATFRRPSVSRSSPPRFPPIVSSFGWRSSVERTDGRNAEWLFEASRFWQDLPTHFSPIHYCG